MARWLREFLPWRDTPVTSSVVAVYVSVNLFVRFAVPNVSSIEQWASTNIINLHAHPVRSILASIFIGDGALVPTALLLLAVAGGVLERHAGSHLAAGIPLLGHVVATLVTEGAVRTAIWMHRAPRSAGWQLDIGISYLGFTAAAAAIRYAPRPGRLAVTAALTFWVGAPVLRTGTMTDWGHACCVAIGFLSWHWLPVLLPLRHAADSTNASAMRGGFHWGKAMSASVVAIASLAGLIMLTAGSRLLPPRHTHRHQSQPPANVRTPTTADRMP